MVKSVQKMILKEESREMLNTKKKDFIDGKTTVKRTIQRILPS